MVSLIAAYLAFMAISVYYVEPSWRTRLISLVPVVCETVAGVVRHTVGGLSGHREANPWLIGLPLLAMVAVLGLTGWPLSRSQAQRCGW